MPLDLSSRPIDKKSVGTLMQQALTEQHGALPTKSSASALGHRFPVGDPTKPGTFSSDTSLIAPEIDPQTLSAMTQMAIDIELNGASTIADDEVRKHLEEIEQTLLSAGAVAVASYFTTAIRLWLFEFSTDPYIRMFATNESLTVGPVLEAYIKKKLHLQDPDPDNKTGGMPWLKAVFAGVNWGVLQPHLAKVLPKTVPGLMARGLAAGALYALRDVIQTAAIRRRLEQNPDLPPQPKPTLGDQLNGGLVAMLSRMLTHNFLQQLAVELKKDPTDNPPNVFDTFLKSPQYPGASAADGLILQHQIADASAKFRQQTVPKDKPSFPTDPADSLYLRVNDPFNS